MSVTNFIPQVWAARVLVNLKNALVFASPQVVNRDWEGEINDVGDTVRINMIGAVQVGDYARNADMDSPQELIDSQTSLTIDQSKYFNFQVDDADALQVRGNLMDQAMQEAAYAIRNTIDQHVATRMVAGVATTNQYNGGAVVPVGAYGTDNRPYDMIVRLSVMLDEHNVPGDNRFVIVPPWFAGDLRLDDRFVSYGTPENRQTLLNGRIGQASGFEILSSNNIVRTGSSSEEYYIVAGHPMATTFAEQVTRVEGYRMERRFADGVKGLTLYGVRVLRPTVLALLKAKPGVATPGS